MEELITWSDLRDRHSAASTSLGRVWIRLDCAERVTGIYTSFGCMEKWVPEPGEQLTLEDGKVQAEFLLAAAKAAKRLAEK